MTRAAVRAIGVVLLLVLTLVSCREHTVAVSFRPEVGDRYRYEVAVHSVTRTVLRGAEPERRDEEVRLVAEHTVLDAGREGVRVRVLLGEPGFPAQAFIVRFDRSSQLQSVESVESAPEEVAGMLGLSEIFPAAAGAPPGRRLAPGDTWTLDELLTVPGGTRATRLTGEGRLDELGVEDGQDVARLSSSATLPLTAEVASPDGVIQLAGRQELTQRATYDLADGAIRTASSTTTGRFTMSVAPPPGTIGDPVPGTMQVRVTSTTRRID